MILIPLIIILNAYYHNFNDFSRMILYKFLYEITFYMILFHYILYIQFFLAIVVNMVHWIFQWYDKKFSVENSSCQFGE
jgi:hypothetical protein